MRLTFRAMVMQVCDAMEEVLLYRDIKLGNVQDIFGGFAGMEFANCIGANDKSFMYLILHLSLV